MRKIMLALGAATVLSGCATGVMSEKECLAGDWFAAGYADGADGKLERAFDARAMRCEEFNVGADMRAYDDGRRAGLDALCTHRGGYDYGLAGSAYRGVCGRNREEEFLSGYLTGRRIFFAEQARGAAQSAHDDAVSQVESYRRDIRRARERLDDPEATEKEKKNARETLDYARSRLPGAERDVDTALYELGRADEAYSQTRASSAGWSQSREFTAIHTTLREAHEFARAHPAIEQCTDETDGFAPICEVRPGARLADSATGASCVIGPGEARFVRRTLMRQNNAPAGAAQAYDFFQRQGDRGWESRRRAGTFDVYFAQNGDYEGLGCSPR